ncbi:MFS transporter [Bacillus sp. FJAT-49711]|uniref:MFS transporter n=1 Tax=Bacillus sp. FJAT-49711 TaxID=2833585 RepID=UPI0032D590B0
MNSEKLWTKEFIAVSTINFLATLMFYLLMVTIATYAKNEFHVSTSTAGLVSSIFIIGSLLGRLFAGRYISDIGTKKVFWCGLILLTVASVCYFGIFNTTTLLLNRLFHGIAFGLMGTAAGTIIAQILPGDRKGEGIGYYSLSTILATAIGPFFRYFTYEIR